jgi:hypothetical protein
LAIVFLVVLGAAARGKPAVRTPAPNVATPTARTSPTASPEHTLALLASCVRPHSDGGLSGTVNVRVSDQTPSDYHFDLSSAGCRIAAGTANSPVLTVTANLQTWRDLAAKRLSFAGAAMNGRIQYTGDTETVVRLDAAFAGTPDESLIVDGSTTSTAVSASEVVDPPSSVDSLRTQRETLVETLKAMSVDPSASPEQRREAIADALRQNLGKGGDVHVSFERVSSTGSSHLSQDVRAAVRKTLSDLPPNATREQKLEAIRSALANVPEAQPFLAMLSGHGSSPGSHGGHGLAARIAETMLERALEGFLEG